MLKVVFDTVVFVRALLNSRGVCGRLVFAHPDRYRLFLSPEVLQEILEVLARPELVERFRLRDADYGRALSGLLNSLKAAETVEPEQIPAVARDPKDDKFLAAAKQAAADYLISEDDDLLVLGEYDGTRIVNCAGFLSILQRQLGAS